MATRKLNKGPGRAISDVTLEAQQTAARYPVNRGKAPADAERFDALAAQMRADAMRRRAAR